MTINPTGGISPMIEQLKPILTQGQTEPKTGSFSEIFEKAIDNVNQTEAAAKQDQLLIATGQADDLHSIMINASKAEMALSMLVQMRNKALDAYNDLMKTAL